MIRQHRYATVVSAKNLPDATYIIVGVVDIGGYGDISLHVKADDTGDNAILKFYTLPDPEASQPTDNTGAYQVLSADGSELEQTVLTDELGAFKVPVSAKWLIIYGKASSTTGVNIDAYLTGTAAMI